jgi:hypothetical protein
MGAALELRFALLGPIELSLAVVREREEGIPGIL